MKTLFVLASVTLALFLATGNKIEAQGPQTPQLVSRLEARVTQLEKRLAAVEAQLARIAGTESGTPQSPGTRNATLTAERAQQAIRSALSNKYPDVTVSVQGVQADPKGTGATADFTFADSPTSRSAKSAQATFKHYTDGRWFLSYIRASNGFWDMSVNVEVK